MSLKQETAEKLLPRTGYRLEEKNRFNLAVSRSARISNILLACGTAFLAAFLLMPPAPAPKPGDTAGADIIAPRKITISMKGPDQSVVIHTVAQGEMIVKAGEVITEATSLVLLEALESGGGISISAYLGLSLLFLVMLYLFYRDIRRYRPKLVGDTRKLFLLALLLIVTLVITYLSRQTLLLIAGKLHLDAATTGYALPAAAGSMLVCLLLDFHLALGFAFFVSIMLGITFHGDPLIPLYYFLGSIVAALSVIYCKKRTAVLRGGAWIALTNVISIIGIDLYRGTLTTQGFHDILAGISGALGVAMVVSVSLPFFETAFDIATDIKLLELLEPNQPLLKKLVYSAPGTYHHSIVIGNLAEGAAEAIGENPLLARVGAYYHDVGKIRKPEYFIENQRSSENRHDRLAPSMSSLIIAAHVKDGVELAREHKLPADVVDIIQQHHGTSLITYFFQKARELQPYPAGLNEADYRYPGPRPATKVAAIVMLSDSVEAASRTLENPTPERIEELTTSVITRIFLNDQLVECDLTLKDLRKITRTFNSILGSIHHNRIDYPGMELPLERKYHAHKDKKYSEEAKAARS